MKPFTCFLWLSWLIVLSYPASVRSQQAPPVDLRYNPATGNLSIDGGPVGPVTSMEIASQAGVFTSEPAVALGDFYRHGLYYITARAQDAPPSVDLGDVLSPNLTTEFLIEDLCITGYQNAGEGRFPTIDSIRLNGILLPDQPADCVFPPDPDAIQNFLPDPRAVVHYDSESGRLRVSVRPGRPA